MRLWTAVLLSLALVIGLVGLAAPAPVSNAQAQPTPTATPTDPGLPPAPSEGKRTTPEQIDTGKQWKASNCQTPTTAPATQGVVPLSVTATGVCFNAGFTVWSAGERTYALLTGGYQAAFVVLDVTDPAHPTVLTTYLWRDDQGNPTPTQHTYTQDAKHFTQGDRHFVSLNHEAFGNTNGFCGIAIVEVTDPAHPQFITRVNDRNSPRGAWCDVHNTFVEPDAAGQGAWLYLTADEPDDLRVLDIRNLQNIVEVGQYKEPGSTYIHDITVVNGRVYVSYWEAGLVILDAASLKPGVQPAPLNPFGSIKPAGFRVHHALPTPDGRYVFIQDEITSGLNFQAVRMVDIRDLGQPREVAALGMPYRQAHNLLVENNRLYVGWYESGLQGWDIDTTDPAAPKLTQAVQHTLRSTFTGGFHGAWGVAKLPCQVAVFTRTCLYLGDIEMGLDIVALQDPAYATADLNQDGQVNIVDLSHVAARWGTRRGDADYYAIFDLNGDGVVNVVDLQAVARQWTG